ncbi:MAG TPA: MerR family transcriptional regulator [Miltoncostaeaceae bacterium]|nr:MerR family transcriptional regulator [Miltoncostaeaceae bacterium]
MATRRVVRTAGFHLIGIAARKAGMHPQTLRVYERRGLIRPVRSEGNTRLYSDEDVQVLLRIQALSEEGLNLAGIERVLDLERRLRAAEGRVRELEGLLEEERTRGRREIEEVRRSVRADLVRVTRTGTALVPVYRPVVPTRREGVR